MEMPRAEQHAGRYEKAADDVNDALRADPTNPDALAFKEYNLRLLEADAGRRPSKEVLAFQPEIRQKQIHVATLVQDGRFLFENGRIDEAESKLQQALREDPDNTGAVYYLNLVKEARYKEAVNRRDVAARGSMVEVENAYVVPPKRELLPVPNPYARTNLVHTGPGRELITSKLNRIRLDSVKYDSLPLSEVIQNLSDESKKRDPQKRGINFIINANVDTGAAAPTGGAIDPA